MKNLEWKVDLRNLRRKEIDDSIIDLTIREIDSLTHGRLREISLTTDKKLTIRGKDSNGIIREEIWDPYEYVKTARRYNSLTSRVNKQRQKYDVEAFDYEPLENLIMRDTKTIKGRVITRGLANRMETVRKVLVKDKVTGKNKIQMAGENLEQLRELKYESIDSPDDLLKKAGIDVKQFYSYRKDGTVRRDKDGNPKFKNKSSRREYLKLLSENTTDEDYEISAGQGEFSPFFGFIYDNYVDKKNSSVKEFFGGLSQDEKRDLMRDYLEDLHDRAAKVEDNENEERKLSDKFKNKNKKGNRR